MSMAQLWIFADNDADTTDEESFASTECLVPSQIILQTLLYTR